jgi:hypothetical protein
MYDTCIFISSEGTETYDILNAYTVDHRKSNGLILEQLETRTKNSRKIRFET